MMPLLFGHYRRYVILVVCLVEMIFMSGVQYGWNGLIPVWTQMGVFGCDNETDTAVYAPRPPSNASGPTVVARKEAGVVEDCSQNFMLMNAFIVSSSSQFLLTLPCGLIFDKLKLRISKLCNAAFFLLACVLMGLVSAERSFLVFLGGVLFSVAAPFILIINFQIGNFFPRWQNLIVALFSGAFDSSSAVFQFMALAYQRLGVSVLASFMVLGVCAALLMVFIAFCLFPREHMMEGAPAGVVEVPAPAEEEMGMVEGNGEKRDEEAAAPPNNGPTFGQVFFTREYIFQLIWFSIIFLRFQFFLSAIPDHADYRFPKSDPNSGPVKGRLFTSLGLLLFCGILFAPIAGLITDGLKKKFVTEGQDPGEQQRNTLRAIGVGEAICSFSGLLLTILIFVSGESVFYVLFLLEVFTRAFLFSLNGAFSVAYYPGPLFGTLFGVMFLLGGIFSCIQFALLKLSIVWSNAIVLVLTIISFLQPVNLIVSPSACCRPR